MGCPHAAAVRSSSGMMGTPLRRAGPGPSDEMFLQALVEGRGRRRGGQREAMFSRFIDTCAGELLLARLLLWSLCWISPCKRCSAVNTCKSGVFGQFDHSAEFWRVRCPAAAALQVGFANGLEWRRKRQDGRAPAPRGRGTSGWSTACGWCLVAHGQAMPGARAPKEESLGQQLPPSFEVGRSRCHSGKQSAAGR